MRTGVPPRVALAAEVYELISHVNHLVGPRGDARVISVKVHPPFHLAPAFELTPPAGRRDWGAFAFAGPDDQPHAVWCDVIPGFDLIRDLARRCKGRLDDLDSPADAAVAEKLLNDFFASRLWAGGEAEDWYAHEDEDGEFWTWGVANLHVPRTSSLELLADKLMAAERAVSPPGRRTPKSHGRPPGQPYDQDLIRLKEAGRLAWGHIHRELVKAHGESVPQIDSLKARYRTLKERIVGVKKG